MPIYEFCCPACGNRFEKLFIRLPDQDPDPECPRCGKAKGHRVLSGVSRIRGGASVSSASCGNASTSPFS